MPGPEFGTPRGEKGPWHFIETITLTPMFKWMSTAWGYLRGQNAAPSPMASIFDEQQATPRKDHANMQALLVKLQRMKQHGESGTKRERAKKNSMETQPTGKPNHTRRTTTAPARKQLTSCMNWGCAYTRRPLRNARNIPRTCEDCHAATADWGWRTQRTRSWSADTSL